MFSKGTKLYSIVNFKCPYCHEGNFFISSNPYDLTKAGDLHKECSVCGRKFEREPGFYYGAMYVSYALAVALCVTVYVACIVLFPNAAIWTRIVAILSTLFLCGPIMYALSKILWATMFMDYVGVEPTKKELAEQERRAHVQA
ncbi:MAG: DUF983 domain-containing protein [Flavobacteriales bacterium]|nr:DUF983 domain-containing protein [Flavobacteriales bacterium]